MNSTQDLFKQLEKLDDDNYEQVYLLDIELVLNNNIDEDLEHRELSKEYQLTDEEFQAYSDFITTVIMVIKNRNFEIVEEYQSDKSYSYYIQFVPEFYDGIEVPIRFDVKFRLSDYKGNNKMYNVENKNKVGEPIFTSFVVNGVEHKKFYDTLVNIINILNDLQAGDYKSLIQYRDKEYNKENKK